MEFKTKTAIALAALVVAVIAVAILVRKPAAQVLGTTSADQITNWVGGNFSGDVTVGGVATLNGGLVSPGTSSLGYTPNQTNVTTAAMNTGTTTICAVLNASGSDRVIRNALIDLAPAGGSAITTTLAYGVTSTAQGTPAGTGALLSGTTWSLSASEQVVATSSVAYLIWPNNTYLVLHGAATTTQGGNCVATWSNF